MQEILETLAKPRLPQVPEDTIRKNSIHLAPADHTLLIEICAAIHGTLLRKKVIPEFCKQIIGDDEKGEKAGEKVFKYLIANPDGEDEHLRHLICHEPEHLGLVNVGNIIGRRAKPGYFDGKRDELLRAAMHYRKDLFARRSPQQCEKIHELVAGRKPSAGIVLGMLVELGVATTQHENISLGRVTDNPDMRTVAIEVRSSAWQQVKTQHAEMNIPIYAIVAGLLRLSATRYTLRDLILETFTCPLATLKKS
jgi:hypothetical protein